MELVRNPTTVGTTIFEFGVYGYRFLVKNFTDGDVYAALKEGATKEESILIPAGCAQIVLENEFDMLSTRTNKIQIIAESASDKGVEVQCIRY